MWRFHNLELKRINALHVLLKPKPYRFAAGALNQFWTVECCLLVTSSLGIGLRILHELRAERLCCIEHVVRNCILEEQGLNNFEIRLMPFRADDRVESPV